MRPRHKAAENRPFSSSMEVFSDGFNEAAA